MTDAAGNQRIWRIALYASLIALVIAYSVPTFGVLLSSFKNNREIGREGLWRWPEVLTFENYETALGSTNVPNYLLNSVVVTFSATALSIAMGILTGYVFSRLAFRGSELLYLAVVAGMFFPPQIVIIPLIQLFSRTPINDTILVLIIVHVAFGLPITTLLLRNFFSTIPAALREAAIIDGANEGQILLKVMLPLSLPALAGAGDVAIHLDLERFPLALHPDQKTTPRAPSWRASCCWRGNTAAPGACRARSR